uniref:Glycos_transf_1 domain-containing protein n=1 Tax=Meloidogyne hapla TaxID=6305 RepID=A0A1I8BP71_MELHA
MKFVLHNRKEPKLTSSEMYSKLGSKSTNSIKNEDKQKQLQNSIKSWLSFSFTFKKLGILTLFILFIYALISALIERQYSNDRNIQHVLRKTRHILRIALIAPMVKTIPPGNYGGTERAVYYLVEALVKRGHKVTLFASNNSNTTSATHVPSGNRIYELGFAYNSIPLISISNDQRVHVEGNPNWIATVHHGLPKDLYKFIEKPQVETGEGPYLAFLGRFHKDKRPDLAIEIAVRASIRLKLAASKFGAGDEYVENIMKMIDKHNDMVEFVGELNDKQKNDFLGNAIASIFPIEWTEPFGLVLIESMACGTPVIARRRGSVPEVVKEGVSGTLFDTIEEAVEQVKKANQFNRAAVRNEFEKRFTSDIMAENYEKVYNKMILKLKNEGT